MVVDLQKEQVEVLLQIVNNTQFKGADAQVVVGLQIALSKALQPVEEPKK